MPSCHSTTSHHRPHTTFAEPYLLKQLTRHRSLSNFAEHDSAYDHLFATPHGNYPLWNDNFPASKFVGSSYQSEYPTRSLSQTNISSRMYNYANALESQLRGVSVDQRKSNYWGFRNSHIVSDLDHSGELFWPKTPSSSSESNQSMSQYRKTLKKTRNPALSGFKNLEKWPKSLESLPKTPTDYRGDNNMPHPVFPCDALRTDSGRQPAPSYTSRVDRGKSSNSNSPLLRN